MKNNNRFVGLLQINNKCEENMPKNWRPVTLKMLIAQLLETYSIRNNDVCKLCFTISSADADKPARHVSS